MSKITIIWPASILRRAFKNRLVTEAEEPTPSAISVRRDAVHRAEPRTDSSSHLCGRWSFRGHLATGPFVIDEKSSCGSRSCRLTWRFRRVGKNSPVTVAARARARQCEAHSLHSVGIL